MSLLTWIFKITHNPNCVCFSVLTFLWIHIACFVYMQFLFFSMYCFNPIVLFPQTTPGAGVGVEGGGQSFSNPILKVTGRNFPVLLFPSLLPSHSVATPVTLLLIHFLCKQGLSLIQFYRPYNGDMSSWNIGRLPVIFIELSHWECLRVEESIQT